MSHPASMRTTDMGANVRVQGSDADRRSFPCNAGLGNCFDI